MFVWLFKIKKERSHDTDLLSQSLILLSLTRRALEKSKLIERKRWTSTYFINYTNNLQCSF
jgi:hypothetical protein